MKFVSFLISLGFFMIVAHIYNITPLISFGFVEYDEEDVAPPILEDYIWLTTNYHRDTHNVIHFFLIVFLNHPFCNARFFFNFFRMSIPLWITTTFYLRYGAF